MIVLARHVIHVVGASAEELTDLVAAESRASSAPRAAAPS